MGLFLLGIVVGILYTDYRLFSSAKMIQFKGSSEE